nr:cytochrome P450 [Agasicles hygrophila]
MLIILIVICASVYCYIKRKQSYWQRKNVDYIEPSFFVGNTSANTTGKIHKGELYQQFYEHFKSNGKTFGGVYSNLTPVLVPTEPALIKAILQTDFAHFMNHEGFVNEEDDPLSGNLFSLKDEKWRNIRSKLTPTFTTGKMRMMFDTMVECTVGLQKLLDPYAEMHDPVDIKKYLLLFTTDIISSVAFGLDVKSLENPNTEFRTRFNKIFEPNLRMIIKQIIIQSVPHWLLKKLRFSLSNREMLKFFVKVVKDIVEYREKNNVYRKDFMHLLIQIKNFGKTTDDEMLKGNSEGTHLTLNQMTAQCITFFIAGFETSSTTMSFALLELAQKMEIQEKIRDEIETVLKRHDGKITYDAIMEMEYLEQALDEALRKHSPATTLSRVCNKEYKIPGTDTIIDPDVHVMVPVYALHRDPKYFPNPEKYDPDRFSKENKQNIVPYTYLPFGEGPRSCIGLRFGKLQSKVGLCSIIRTYKITLNEKTKVPVKYAQARIPTVQGGIWLNLEKIN